MALNLLKTCKSVVARASVSNVARCMGTLPLNEFDGNLAPTPDFKAPFFGGVEVTTTSNGVTVVTEDNNSPTSKVSVVVAAGSRNEGVENAGVSHILRQLAFKSNEEKSSLAMQRYSDAIGAQVSCKNDREVITYSAKFLKKDLELVMDNLSAASSKQAFKSWDVTDTKAHTAAFLDGVPAESVMMDALHAGAFRNVLGNSTTVAPYKLDDISREVLVDYYNNFFTAGNITVVGAGVDHAEMVNMVELNFGHVEAKDVPASTATYYGGYESRVASGTGDANVAVAYAGVGRGSDEQIASMVLEQVARKGISGVKTINLNYNDTGLFGVSITSKGKEAASKVPAAVDGLKKILGGSFTDDDVNRAKKSLMAAILDMSAFERAEFYANQVLATKQPLTPEQFAGKVEAVTTSQIQSLAKKIGASKPVISSAGNVDYVPYASELGL